MPLCWVWTLTGGFLPPRFHVGARLPQLGHELADGTFPLLQRAQQLEGVGSLVYFQFSASLGLVASPFLSGVETQLEPPRPLPGVQSRSAQAPSVRFSSFEFPFIYGTWQFACLLVSAPVCFVFFIFLFLIFIYLFFCLFLFLAVLGLRCCAQAFSSCGERGPLLVAIRGLLIVVASLVAEHGL